MKIKTKVRLGVLFLFAVILTIGGLGLYSVERLSHDSKNILVDNYESLQYSQRIIANCDSLKIDSTKASSVIESNLRLQENNVTEKGEGDLTNKLRSAFEKVKNNGIRDVYLLEIRSLALQLQNVNMQAIVRKNEVSQKTSNKASMSLIIIGTLCTLAAFTFIMNFPGYVADPIVQLTKSIKSIAGKDYEERLHFDRNDEFEELAEAFNQMAEKLDEYEHSNLAKILFEKKRIETIINQMTDPVIGIDQSKKVIFVNDRALGLLNLNARDILEKYAPDIAVYNDLFRNLIQEDNRDNSSNGLIKAIWNGKENYYSKETVPINYLPTGEKEEVHLGKYILLKNITSFKELDLAKTNFIATISHELKTPIASLQLCAKLLHDERVGKINDEQEKILETLNDEVTRLSKLTNELLDLAQVETGHIRLSIKQAQPEDIVGLAMEAIKFQAERKRISIKTKMPNDSPRVAVDLDKTTWVLVNFLTNAIRHSPENEEVMLTCEIADNRLRVAVTDHGPGIEKKYLPKLFDKFFQVPGTSNGSGLGLGISKELIEAQGGEIGVTSSIGAGSEFYFYLPLLSPVH